MANEYEPGDRVRLSGEFRVAGVLTNPTAVTVKVKKPSNTVDTYTGGQVTADGTGLYHLDVTTSEHGTWAYRFEGTGAAESAGESAFTVKHSRFL